MNAIVTIDFRGDTLFAVERAEGVYIAVTPICQTLGLDAKKQRERIQRDVILSEGGAMMALPSTGGIQETFCLRLDLINGWLFTIDESRVKDEETRQRVLAYKRECYRVLFEHFHGGRAGQRDSRDGDTFARNIELERHDVMLVNEARMVHGKAFAARLWFEFGLPGRPADALPPHPALPADVDGAECVARLLAADLDGMDLRAALLAAIGGDAAALASLLSFGVRPAEHTDGFWVSTNAEAIVALYAGTKWRDGSWRAALRSLPGAAAGGKVRFGLHQSKSIFLPFALLG